MPSLFVKHDILLNCDSDHTMRVQITLNHFSSTICRHLQFIEVSGRSSNDLANSHRQTSVVVLRLEEMILHTWTKKRNSIATLPYSVLYKILTLSKSSAECNLTATKLDRYGRPSASRLISWFTATHDATLQRRSGYMQKMHTCHGRCWLQQISRLHVSTWLARLKLH